MLAVRHTLLPLSSSDTTTEAYCCQTLTALPKLYVHDKQLFSCGVQSHSLCTCWGIIAETTKRFPGAGVSSRKNQWNTDSNVASRSVFLSSEPRQRFHGRWRRRRHDSEKLLDVGRERQENGRDLSKNPLSLHKPHACAQGADRYRVRPWYSPFRIHHATLNA